MDNAMAPFSDMQDDLFDSFNGFIGELGTENGKDSSFQKEIAADVFAFIRERSMPGYITDTQKLDELVTAIFKLIDDKNIMSCPNTPYERKAYALFKKYGRLPELSTEHGKITYSHAKSRFFDSVFAVRIDFIELENDCCIIEGWVPYYNYIGNCCDGIKAMVNSRTVDAQPVDRHEYVCILGETAYEYRGFRLEIPLSESEETDITLFSFAGDVGVHRKKLLFNKFCPINSSFSNSYYYKDGYLLTRSNGGLLVKKAKFEAPYVKRLSIEMLKSRHCGIVRVVLERILYFLFKPLCKKQIWLISDRVNKAGDNAEAFFRYLCSTKPKGIDFYFVVSKKSPSFSVLKKLGKVIDDGSLKHRLKLIFSDTLISSQSYIYIRRPIMNEIRYYSDIVSKQRYIFLQHGITKDDRSKWLNKYNLNIAGLVTAAKAEYDSVLEYNYYYTDKQVWLTGFPRFDRLYDDKRNEIVFMPTWRNYLMPDVGKGGVRKIGSDFVDSDYFKFCNALINDKRLLEAAKKYSYKLRFFPHPNIIPYIDLFKHSEGVEFMSIDSEYIEAYAHSKLIVTDYSSAVFDFAYLRKPIIYSQFDRETVFGGALTCVKGYFDCERDGFGEVEYNLDDTVERIIDYMNNGCNLKDKYRQRIDGFFKYNDKNNSQRVLNKILELDR